MNVRLKSHVATKPPMSTCQVCREVRPEECVATSTFDVSSRFGLEDLVYIIVDHCFDRRQCKLAAKEIALRFAGGDDVHVRELTGSSPLSGRPA